jgi:hypothetical protein
MMDEIGEETLFFALSNSISHAHSAATGGRLDHDLADSIAFGVLETWSRNKWRVFGESVEQREAMYAGLPSRPRQMSYGRPPPSNDP